MYTSNFKGKIWPCKVTGSKLKQFHNFFRMSFEQGLTLHNKRHGEKV
jgi:hypothetical protein